MKKTYSLWSPACAALIVNLLAAFAASAGVVATGGNSTNDIGGYRIHTFTNGGTFTVDTGGNVDVLVVGGGGGGGGYVGGGGGAGGLIYTTAFPVVAGPISVTIGAGGAGGANSTTDTGYGGTGSVSVFSTLMAAGGGRGGKSYVNNTGTGGSGGGAGTGNPGPHTGQTGTAGQGKDGGSSSGAVNGGSGGGGGAGTSGTNGTASKGGDGGAGLSISISGSPVVYAGGGGGANYSGGADGFGGAGGGGDAANPGRAGTATTGGGGGGGGINPTAAGGAGGSGIVIVRYVLPLEVRATAATSIGSTKATLNGRLGGDGDDTNTTVAFCWGDSDGGTVATSLWTHVIPLGANWPRGRSFATNLTGLTAGSSYAFRCYATNSTAEDWSDLGTFTPSAVIATGGNSTNTLDGYRIHTFTTSGTFTVSAGGYVDVLAVAGGGGGGGYIGGGGGGGGLIYTQSFPVVAGGITVTVGAGGAGGANASTTGFGGAGSNSVFATVTAIGGGRGGANYVNNNTGSGGSGGGAGSSMASGGPALGQSGTTGQGNNGGNSSFTQNYGGGGGGGAGTVGSSGTDAKGGNGGDGVSNSISGDAVVYAGGGGGACYSGTAPTRGTGGSGGGGHAGNPGTNGTANTGGGGGGGGVNTATSTGGGGGSGIVIVRYVFEGALKPVVRADSASALGATRATLNGTVLSVGGAENPYSYFCWGYGDGGTNGTSAWANVTFVGTNWGQNQSFSRNITGLLSASNYAYRCYVTNSSGKGWSDGSVTFTTVGLPTVTNRGTVGVGDRLGALQGAVTATGGEIPHVWFEYWPVGGAVTSTWDSGLQSGAFTNVVTGLNRNAAYQFRVRASNDAGTVWSSVSNFTTAAWMVIDNEDAGFSYNLVRATGHSPFGAYNDSMGWSETATTGNWARWTFTGLTNGNYDVAVCHSKHTKGGWNRYTVSGGLDGYSWYSSIYYGYWSDVSLVDTVGVSRAFRIINTGPVKVTDGTLQVQQIGYPGGAMVADAVAVTPTSNRTVFISDDKSGIFTNSMPGWNPGWDGWSADSSYRFASANAGAANEWTKWVFAGATPGKYKVWAVWTPGANRATNVPFVIYSADEAQPLGTNVINQEVGPANDVQDWLVRWQQLTNGAAADGTYRFTSTVFSVRVKGVDNSSGNDYVIADAIRVELVQAIAPHGTVFKVR